MSDSSPERRMPGPSGTAAGDEGAAEPAEQSGVTRGGAAASGGSKDGPEALIGTMLAGRYRVEDLLGTGGMGAVYRAQHVHMKKSVAVKVLHREMTYLPEVVARFEREAVAAARIEHANVAAATDFGKLDSGSFYLVLEYIEGKSLRKLISEHGMLVPELALHITRQIADALSAAHDAGVVHRDLKPDNVMLIEKDGDPHFVKVLDFGIAKVTTGDAAQQLTQLGSVFGTPEYMSPEQAAGTPVDLRADLYTLGIITYEMLAGETPFDNDDMVVVLTRQMTMDPPPLPEHVAIPVRNLVNRLLAKDPDARFQSAAELIAEIDRTMGSVAVGTGSPPPSVVSVSPTPGSVAGSAAGSTQLSAQDAYSETVLSIQRPPVASQAAVSAPALTQIGNMITHIDQRVPPALRGRVAVAGQGVPVWSIGLAGVLAGLLGVLLVVVFAVVRGGDDDAGAGRVGRTEKPAKVIEPDLQRIMDRASSGDTAAIAELQARPEGDRSAAEWRALGRGLAVARNYKDSISAYAKALEGDPSLASDKEIVADVHRAAMSPPTAAPALNLAASALGPTGADLVYDVWSDTKSDKSASSITKLAATKLEDPSLRQRASPALAVALDLNDAKGCAQYKTVLPRAAQHADERSVSKLRRLTTRRGCGFLGLGDCFSCLRRGTDLSDALKRAQATPAPDF